MLDTKQDAAKSSASSEILKNRWLSTHWACQIWVQRCGVDAQRCEVRMQRC